MSKLKTALLWAFAIICVAILARSGSMADGMARALLMILPLVAYIHLSHRANRPMAPQEPRA